MVRPRAENKCPKCDRRHDLNLKYCRTCGARLPTYKRKESKMNRATVLLATILLLAGSAYADPRMETNDDFCHFIEDAADTDKEVFMADCGATINVNGTADGFSKVVKKLPQGLVTEATFTNDDSATPCTMVESNGTEYVSNRWISKIRVIHHRWRPKSLEPVADPFEARLVYVAFELHCLDGVQQ